jgi:hypothetical protein
MAPVEMEDGRSVSAIVVKHLEGGLTYTFVSRRFI